MDYSKFKGINVNFIKYTHHGNEVYVREDLKGKHREYCMCFTCDNFGNDGKKLKCEIAEAIFQNCIKYKLVTPVWECPNFVIKEQDSKVKIHD